MILKDAIDYIEGSFDCKMGAPWRWADLAMSKPYQTLSFDMDVPSLSDPADVEHRLVARLINAAQRIKSDTGFGADKRPSLFWRWEDKVRMVPEAGCMVITTRIYIDGNPGYSHSNPSKPGGTPAAGQIRFAA